MYVLKLKFKIFDPLLAAIAALGFPLLLIILSDLSVLIVFIRKDPSARIIIEILNHLLLTIS